MKKAPAGQLTALPVTGHLLPIEQVTDEVFASRQLVMVLLSCRTGNDEYD